MIFKTSIVLLTVLASMDYMWMKYSEEVGYQRLRTCNTRLYLIHIHLLTHSFIYSWFSFY